MRRIKSNDADIGVIALGYVGLPLVVEFCRAGCHVTEFDVDPEKVKQRWTLKLGQHVKAES